MKTIIAINNKIKACPSCYSIHGIYDTKTKETHCQFCGQLLKVKKGDR